MALVHPFPLWRAFRPLIYDYRRAPDRLRQRVSRRRRSGYFVSFDRVSSGASHCSAHD